jgi:predicted helicase
LISRMGVSTNRDTWVYNFDKMILANNVQRFIETYNTEVARWNTRSNRNADLDNFVLNDETRIKWSSRLKECLKQNRQDEFSNSKIRNGAYRPFCRQFLFFDDVLIHRQSHFPTVFPDEKSEKENLVIALTDKGSEKPFMVLMTNHITDLHVVGAGSGTQCFPFYIYNEDGGNRRENISDWAVEKFNDEYGMRNAELGDSSFIIPHSAITKWDIFYYVYALLHSPAYREKYAANLKRDLPHIPFVDSVETFWKYVEAGKKLAELHVNYESQAEYPLEMVENPETHLNWRVEKMKLIKPTPTQPPAGSTAGETAPNSKSGNLGEGYAIVYNDFLTLKGIPAEAFEYRLGNRSALDWVIDQYRVTTDPRSKIVNDPNDSDDPQYIVRLVKKVVTVSVETVKNVKGL